MLELIGHMSRAVLSQVLCFFVGLVLAWWWQKRSLRRLIREYEKQSAQRNGIAVALVLSVRDDISQSARAYLAQNNLGDVPVFKVHQSEGFDLTGSDWMPYLEEVKAELRRAREFGFTRIYLFTNVPVAVALFIGAAVCNGPEVVVHHFCGGTYVPIGRLAFETVKL